MPVSGFTFPDTIRRRDPGAASNSSAVVMFFPAIEPAGPRRFFIAHTTERLPAYDAFIVKDEKRSPQIKRVSWGRIELEGKAEAYKDAKLFPGGSRAWNWRETGTDHVPGIQPADVQELLDHGAKVVVLSRGMAECLQVPPETLDFLKERQIAAHVLPTAEAVELYNQLAENEPVGGLFHTTC
jgi:hypothetical protein